jgi:hypothetical protein
VGSAASEPSSIDQGVAVLPQAGWYEDPEYGGQLRWWDGAGWTTDRRAMPLAASSALRPGISGGDVAPPGAFSPPQVYTGSGRGQPAQPAGYLAGQPGYGQTQWTYPPQPASGAGAPTYDQGLQPHSQSPGAFLPSGRDAMPRWRRGPIYAIVGSAAVLMVVVTVVVLGATSSSSRAGSTRLPSLVPPHHVKRSALKAKAATPKTTPTTLPTEPATRPAQPSTKPTTPTTIPALRGPSEAVRERAFLAELASAPAPYRSYPGPARRLVRLGDRECRLARHVALDGSWWDVIQSSRSKGRSRIPAVQAEQLVVAAHRTLCPAETTSPALAVFTTDFRTLGAEIDRIPLRSKGNVEDADLVSALSCSILDRTDRPSVLSKALRASVRHDRLALPLRDVGRASTAGVTAMCASHLSVWTRFVRTKGALDQRRLGRATTRVSRIRGEAGDVLAPSRGR